MHRGDILIAAVFDDHPIGTVNGTSRERSFDRWFRYPAGFSASALRASTSALELMPGKTVLDPFCGTATSAFAEVLRDHPFVGIEAHPLIADLARMKLRAVDQNRLRALGAELGDSVTPGSGGEEHSLVRRCFSPWTLDVLVGLREAIEARRTCPLRHHLRWALLGTLRDVANVKVGWPYLRPDLERVPPHLDAATRFAARCRMMAEDLADPRPADAWIVRGDARSASAWSRAAARGPFDASITSPPYLNNFDYADATRLELYFLRRTRSWRELREQVRDGLVVATTQQSTRPAAGRALAALRRHPTTHRRVSALADNLAAERAKRPRGKEYDQLVPTYFADLARILEHLRRHLHPGARSAWVIGDSAPYGVYVDTPAIVLALAADIGFEPVSDEEIRSRGLRWRTNGTRHQVPLSERLIVFDAPVRRGGRPPA